MVPTYLEAIEKQFEMFPICSRDHILRLYLGGDRRKIRRLNEQLLRAREKGIVDVCPHFRPYVYHRPSISIRRLGGKTEHHLAVVELFTQMVEESREKRTMPPKLLGYEVNFGKGYPAPDMIVKWKGMTRFVEVQRSRISTRRMKEKIEGYENLYFDELHKPYGDRFVLWLVTKHRYPIKSSIPFIQTVWEHL